MFVCDGAVIPQGQSMASFITAAGEASHTHTHTHTHTHMFVFVKSGDIP